MKLKQDFWVGWAIAAIVIITSCWDQTTSQRQQPDIKREISLKVVPLHKTKVVMGQTVYVPIYSQKKWAERSGGLKPLLSVAGFFFSSLGF